ncbi:MAG: hypothetical protein A2268_13790 [Candidatus Raymondbacteria bacterium RifOxyA12_full_50_37]|uniref:PcRGLX/YetA-like central beta-sandwich domain-containing protein n=1 Tax=Candidatus Raymondbacteria bacterium RIFOXYD12_FULL_49_13 TaxID=1817890 RepID=A0A1F7FLM5_UNCRA|nr:MAG: hypothetical protein A2248_08055 [Candidatus Raymondbacteria bacterium RIFOXYA2_FULL_49_16]OGJ87194.1 MAG: hypothetical protein A2350_04305 [Candidatus Raymondbacteria bacterium RifOxyB12_full_50_8]OGJ91681.1 MAG: hypothetical protein A2268_13790 [Candidatus Raymondbacteria bacterium RifOxyA12_full_50_37]OGJ95208.1 MAG: hypothetical protein A2453_12065 [Candidatus Raymondbacteria bacterium RIFOXYC2_FULL_50_21]OGK07568.1 MAG: hypothetical protein A2519_01585 [Candidatus Raymondbacteria b
MKAMIIAFAGCVCFAGCGLMPGQKLRTRDVEIPLTVTNSTPYVQGRPWIQSGIPFAPSTIASASDLRVLDPRGVPVAAQIIPLSFWKNKGVRWALVEFFGQPFAPGETRNYTLVSMTVRPAHQILSLTRDNDSITVNTGAAVFTLDASSFSLFRKVSMNGRTIMDESGRSGFFLVDTLGNTCRMNGSAYIVVEDSGSESVTLKATGGYLDPEGNTLVHYVLRMQFFAGSATVRLFHTLKNPRPENHKGNNWDLGAAGSLFFRDMSLVLRPTDPAAYTEALIGRDTTEVPLPVTLASGLNTPVLLHQESSGGKSWNAQTHMNRFYRVPMRYQGFRLSQSRTVLAQGDQARGVLVVSSKNSGIGLGMRHFWQNFPAALSIGDSACAAHLFPGSFGDWYELRGGEQKTHELTVTFFNPAKSPIVDITHLLTAAQYPLLLRALPAYYMSTKAFFPFGPVDTVRAKNYEHTSASAIAPTGPVQRTYFSQRWVIDEWGWRDFGDAFADHECDHTKKGGYDFPVSHYNNEYDVADGAFGQWVRSGERAWFTLAEEQARHSADIDIYHTCGDLSPYNHGMFAHTTHGCAAWRSGHRSFPIEGTKFNITYASGGPETGHQYTHGLFQYFYLSGIRFVLDAALENAEFSQDARQRYVWLKKKGLDNNPRGYPNLLLGQMNAYLITGEQRYYDQAMELIRMVQPGGRKPGVDMGMGMLGRNLDYFLSWKEAVDGHDRDFSDARATLLDVGDLVLRSDKSSWWSVDFMVSDAVLAAYSWANDKDPNRDAYRKKGVELFESAEKQLPSTYCGQKTLVQVFGYGGKYLQVMNTKGR